VKILFLTSRFPYPLEKGDKLRAYHQIRGLGAKHDVFLASLTDEPVAETSKKALEPYCREIFIQNIPSGPLQFEKMVSWLSGAPAQIAYFKHKAAGAAIDHFYQRIKPDVVICQLLRMAPYTFHWKALKVLDYMDAFASGAKRQAEKKNLRSIFWKIEAKRIGLLESGAFHHFDQHWIISARDRDELNLEAQQQASVEIVPNGIDTEYFKPPSGDFPRKYDLVFVGNMGYLPNIQAAHYLIAEVMPVLERSGYKPSLLIAGARPPESLLKLENDRIKVSGWMEDIREAYHSGKIFVAPLFTGSGLQNKLLEAMASGLPCITTPLAAEALAGQKVAITKNTNNPEGFANHIIDYLKNEDKRLKDGTLAREFVRSNYQWPIFIEQMNVYLQKLRKV